MSTLIKFFIIAILCYNFGQLTSGDHCFGPPVNYIFGYEENAYCPWHRNLMRHVPVQDGCPSGDHYRKFKNCLSDKDCTRGSYCCISICQGITRCYDPLENVFTDQIPKNDTKKPCPLLQGGNCQVKEETTTTERSKPIPVITPRPFGQLGDDEPDPSGPPIQTSGGRFINEDGV